MGGAQDHIDRGELFPLYGSLSFVLVSQESLQARLRLTPLCDEKLGFPELPAEPPSAEDLESNEAMLKELHSLLVETQMMEGKLVCGHCGHEYHVREGIANFLLPSHLV